MRLGALGLFLLFPVFLAGGEPAGLADSDPITLHYDVRTGIVLEQGDVSVNMLNLAGSPIEKSILDHPSAVPAYRFQQWGRPVSEILIMAGSGVGVVGVLTWISERPYSPGNRNVKRVSSAELGVVGGVTILAGVGLLLWSFHRLDESVSLANRDGDLRGRYPASVP